MPEAHYSAGQAAWAILEGFGEAAMSAAEKLIPQGAAELAQGLYTGNAYVPYGPTDMAVPMQDDPAMGGAPQIQAPEVSANDSYNQMLDSYASRGASVGQSQELER